MENPPQVSYEADYGGFEDDPYFRRKISRILTQEIAQLIAPGSTVLDVGCGNGVFLEEAHRHGYAVKGIDTSRAAIDDCVSRGLNAEYVPLEDVEGSFDLLTMWDVIEHVLEPRPFVAHAGRVLKPGGILIIKTPYAAHGAMYLKALWPILLQMPAHVQFFTAQSLSQLLSSSGFSPRVRLTGRFRRPKGVSSVRSLAGRVLRETAQLSRLSRNLYAVARRG